MREQFPRVLVTESHPNAILNAMRKNYGAFFDKFKVEVKKNARKHEKDAVIAAISAREGFRGQWKKDLIDLIGPLGRRVLILEDYPIAAAVRIPRPKRVDHRG